MDFENNNNNQQETVETVEEVVEDTQQYTGCDEDLSTELTDEEYEQMLEEIPEEEPVKKNGFKDFIADLKNQAVCKLLFLFAAIGFIFPFFSEYDQGKVTTFTTGITTFNPYLMLGSVEVGRAWILIAAFALVVLGFILTVCLKDEIRNIVGFVCSAAAAVCMGIFAYMLPSSYEGAVTKALIQLSNAYSQMYGFTIDFTDEAIRAQMGLDVSGMKAFPSTGFWFVAAILVVLVVYFITQIIKDSKDKAAVEMTFTEGEFPEDFDEELYDEEFYDEDVAAELEETLEEATEVVEEETTEE